MMQWYVLHTNPHSERLVALLFQQKYIETYLPEIDVVCKDQRRRMKPFFPGYLFAQIDLEMGESSSWKWTPGLRYVVSYGEQPIPVPGEIIKSIEYSLRNLQSGSGHAKHKFKAGDTVRIKDGPFKDMLAEFDGPMTSSARVQVLLKAVHHVVRLRVDAKHLEKITKKTVAATRQRRSRRTRGRGRRIS